MKTIGAVLLFVVIIVGLLAIGGAVLLSLAYGLGLLVSLVTHFELFQATVLALIAILAAGILVERIWKVIISSNSGPLRDKLDSIDTDDEDDFE